MADPLIEPSAVEARLGETLVAPETDQVTSLITYASARLRRLVPRLDARMADWSADPGLPGALDPDLVTGAMVSAVVRALDSSRIGRRVQSEEYPEVKTTYATSDEDYSGVYFTEDELADLAPVAVGGGTGGAFTITPARAG